MLWRTPSIADDAVLEPEPVLLSEGEPPELPPFVEQERQPPRKESKLIYKRTRMPDGSVHVSAVPVPGMRIDEVIKVLPSNGGDPIFHIIMQPTCGRPTKSQTNGADHAE